MRSFALVLVAGLAGCGSGGGGGSGPKASAWSGSWAQGGTAITVCGAVSETTDLSGVVVISAGTKSGTIQTSSNSCVLTWDASGDTATLENGQSCALVVFGTNATVTWTTGSATLASDAITVTGTVAGTADNGCSSLTQQFTLTRM